MTTGELIKQRRKDQGISAEMIAEKLKVSPATIYRYENGAIQKIPLEKAKEISKILNIDIFSVIDFETASDLLFNGLASNVQPMPSTYKVPRLGRIACGDPILAEENIEDYDDVPSYIKCDFTLICRGDSMINARIFDGDIVCIKADAEVNSGDIAAVLVDDDTATLKRVRLFDDHIILEPENPTYKPKVFWNDDMNRVRIIGKATHFISVVK